MVVNKALSADALIALVRAGFEQIPDKRAENVKISLPDALMSGYAMFSLKDPSAKKIWIKVGNSLLATDSNTAINNFSFDLK